MDGEPIIKLDSLLWEHSHDGIGIIDFNSKLIIAVNPAFTKIIGYGSNEIIHKTLDEIDLFFDIKDKNKILSQLIYNEVSDYTMKIVDKDSNILNVIINAKLFTHSKQQLILFVMKDVTKFVLEFERNEYTIKELKRKNHELSKLKELIPICPECNTVKSDQSFWDKVIEYVFNNKEDLKHYCLCEKCSKKKKVVLKKVHNA